MLVSAYTVNGTRTWRHRAITGRPQGDHRRPQGDHRRHRRPQGDHRRHRRPQGDHRATTGRHRRPQGDHRRHRRPQGDTGDTGDHRRQRATQGNTGNARKCANLLFYLVFSGFQLPKKSPYIRQWKRVKSPYFRQVYVVIAVQHSFLMPLFIHPRLIFKKKIQRHFPGGKF